MAIAMRGDNDDVLFRVDGVTGFECAVVHLTWSGQAEGPPFPMSELFVSFDDWRERGMVRDHVEWSSGG